MSGTFCKGNCYARRTTLLRTPRYGRRVADSPNRAIAHSRSRSLIPLSPDGWVSLPLVRPSRLLINTTVFNWCRHLYQSNSNSPSIHTDIPTSADKIEGLFRARDPFRRHQWRRQDRYGSRISRCVGARASLRRCRQQRSLQFICDMVGELLEQPP